MKKEIASMFKNLAADALQPLNFRLSKQANSYIALEIKSLRDAYLLLSGSDYFENKTKKQSQLLEMGDTSHDKRKQKELKKILKREGSDKSTRHSYEKIYCKLLSQLSEDCTIVEVGIGSSDSSSIGFMGSGYRAGASLRAWKKFLPKARVIGADFDESTLIPQEGLELVHVDQRSESSLENLSQFLGKNSCELIIDDGLHNPLAAIKTFLALWPCLKPGGFYVIEDMSAPMKKFYEDMSWSFSDCSHKFFDLSVETSRLSNCLSVYRKL